MTKHKKSRRYLTAAVVLALMLSLLSGCGKDEVELVRPFTVATADEPDSMNPADAEGELAQEFFLLVYDPLWRIDEYGQPQACLVDSYSLSSDKLTWTIRIRQDVTFSDGTALTARDVLFSYQMLGQYSNLYADYFDGIEDMRCPDDYTLVITCSYVKADMMYNPTPILPRHLWSDYQYSPSSYDNSAMIGSGPFIYEYQTGEDADETENISVYVFNRNENYFTDGALTSTVRFAVYASESAAGRALAAGEADAAFGLTDVQLTTMTDVGTVQLITAQLPRGDAWALAYNTGSEFFSDRNNRILIEQAIDKAEILSMSCGGAGQTGSVFAVPGTDYFLSSPGSRDYDSSAVHTALMSSGYADSDEDGILEDTRSEAELTLTLFSSDEDEWAPTVASIISDCLSSVGISVVWNRVEGDITDSCSPGGDWDMCLLSWQGNASGPLAAGQYADLMQSVTGWTDDSYAAALSLARQQEDLSAAYSALVQLQQIAWQADPASVLIYPADIQAIRTDFWTGYEDILSAAGALFGIGSAAVYMQIQEIPAVG